MAKRKKLCVEGEGKRHFISVPVGIAAALHDYLRGHHVRSSPPAPAYTGFDSIELGIDIDVRGVQVLLNAWESKTAPAPTPRRVRNAKII